MPQKEGGEGVRSGGLGEAVAVSRGPVDVSPTASMPVSGAQASPRAALAADLAGHLARLLAAGDVEGARIAHETIGQLLAGEPSGSAAVLDLATDRRTCERYEAAAASLAGRSRGRVTVRPTPSPTLML